MIRRSASAPRRRWARPPAAAPTPCASVEKLRSALQGNDAAAYRHQHYSDIFDAQIDILARAVVCGLTRVATIQAGSADGNVTDPVGPGYPHHNTSHGNQDIFAQCQQWYATKFLRLLRALDVPDPLDPGKTRAAQQPRPADERVHAGGAREQRRAGAAGGPRGRRPQVRATSTCRSASNKTLMQTVLQLCGVGGGAAPHFGGGTFSELRA